jgi:hypothetical protein
MSYTPQNLTGLVPPIETLATVGSSPLRVCVENHNELYTLSETPVAGWAGGPIASPTGTELSVLRWLSARGYDYASGGLGIQLRVKVIARSTTAGAGGDLKLYGGSSTVTAAVSGSTFATYTLTATPAAANEEWTLALAPGAGKVLEVCSMVAYWVAAAPGVRAYPSQWRQTVTANYGTPGLFLADGNGWRNAAAEWGVAVDGRYDSCALADLDHDGALDLVKQHGRLGRLAALPVLVTVPGRVAAQNDDQHPGDQVAIFLPEVFDLVELFLFFKVEGFGHGN